VILERIPSKYVLGSLSDFGSRAARQVQLHSQRISGCIALSEVLLCRASVKRRARKQSAGDRKNVDPSHTAMCAEIGAGNIMRAGRPRTGVARFGFQVRSKAKLRGHRTHAITDFSMHVLSAE
jgi:hypothetical protein